MADPVTPEAGTRCRVQVGKGEELAVWTGHMWCTDEGSRILEASEIESWEEAPSETELTIRQQDEEG